MDEFPTVFARIPYNTLHYCQVTKRRPSFSFPDIRFSVQAIESPSIDWLPGMHCGRTSGWNWSLPDSDQNSFFIISFDFVLSLRIDAVDTNVGISSARR